MNTEKESDYPYSRRQFLRTSFSAVGLSTGVGQVAGQNDLTDTQSGRPESMVDRFEQQQSLTIGGQDSGDRFGTSIDVSADETTAIIGAIDDGTRNGSSTGSGYIFTRGENGWTKEQRIVADDGESGDRFGISVSITEDGNTVLIGANGVDQSKGAAYEFVRNDSEWVQQEKFDFEEIKREDQFGTSTALSNDGSVAFIGAPNFTVEFRDPESEVDSVFGDGSDISKNTGALYLVERKGGGWSKEKAWYVVDHNTLHSTDNPISRPGYESGVRQTGDTYFGRSISLSDDGTTALVSAQKDRNGSAYLLTKENNEWSHRNFSPRNDNSDAEFGNSVSITADGTKSLIVAPNELDSDGRQTGAAYVINTTTGERSRLTVQTDIDEDESEEAIPLSDVGSSMGAISSDGDVAVIDTEEHNPPFLFAYIDDNWEQIQEISIGDEETTEQFGYETELFSQGSKILTSDPFYNAKGAVFEFAEIEETDSNNSTDSNLPGLGFGSAIIGAVGGGYLLHQYRTDE